MLFNSYSSYSSGGVESIPAFDVEAIQGLNTKNISSSYPASFDDIVSESGITYKNLLSVSGSGMLMFAKLNNTATYIYTNGKPATNKGDLILTCKYRITIDGTVLLLDSSTHTTSVSGNQADSATNTFDITLFNALSLSYPSSSSSLWTSYGHALSSVTPAISNYIKSGDNKGRILEVPIAFNESLKIEAGMGTTGINTLSISGCEDVAMTLIARYILL